MLRSICDVNLAKFLAFDVPLCLRLRRGRGVGCLVSFSLKKMLQRQVFFVLQRYFEKPVWSFNSCFLRVVWCSVLAFAPGVPPKSLLMCFCFIYLNRLYLLPQKKVLLPSKTKYLYEASLQEMTDESVIQGVNCQTILSSSRAGRATSDGGSMISACARDSNEMAGASQKH